MKILMPEANTLTRGDADLSAIFELGDVTTLENPNDEELALALRDADAVLVNKCVLNEKTLAGAENLRYIGECATGFNNIDLEYCNSRGITVTNVPNYSTNAVAQQVFAYILSHYSKVDKYNDFVQDNGWINSKTFAPFVFSCDELYGKTIGLVGYGKIGKAVAKIADAFGMNVLVYTRSYAKALEMSRASDRFRGDRYGEPQVAATALDSFLNNTDSFVSYVTLDNLLCHSDIVSVHCPLNAESAEMFNAEAFAKMRKGAFFINTARGGVLNEQALSDALKSGRLSGAALDVLNTEPMSADCPLLGLPNCIITPHVAWAPLSTRRRLISAVAENLRAFQNDRPINVVNDK